MFLLAGHEVRVVNLEYMDLLLPMLVAQTSGHTLGFALNVLALYQDEQERLYEHIKQVLPDGRMPVSDAA
jgi:cytochrome P450